MTTSIKVYIFNLILFISWLEVCSQPNIEWQKCLGGSAGDFVRCALMTSDGGAILTGHTESFNGDVNGWSPGYTFGDPTTDFWIVKVDSLGQFQWQQCLGGAGEDGGQEVIELSNDSYLAVGNVSSSNGDFCWVSNYTFAAVNLDFDGNVIWKRCYSAAWSAWSAIQTADDNLIITASGNGDIWLLKIDLDGNEIWNTYLGGSYGELKSDIKETADGGLIMAGVTRSNDVDVSGNHGYYDIWLVKLDVNGSLLWQKCFGGSSGESDDSFDVKVLETVDYGYIIAGTTESNDGDVSGNHGGYDAWVFKVDGSGNLEWQKCYGGTNDDDVRSIEKTSDGGYILIGTTLSVNGDVQGNNGYSDMWVVKIDSEGNLQWQKCLGGTSAEYGYSAHQTNDGGYFLGGMTSTQNNGDVSGNHGFYDFWLVKLSTDLSVESPFQKNSSLFPNPSIGIITIPGSPSLRGQSFSIVDSTGNLVYRGSFNENASKLNLTCFPDGLFLLTSPMVGVMKFVIER